MRKIILAVLFLIPVPTFAQSKWRVADPNGSIYAVGRTSDEALARRRMRFELEGEPESMVGATAILIQEAAIAEMRRAEEEATEILFRLEQLDGLAKSNPGAGVADTVRATMARYHESQDRLETLGEGLRRALLEASIASLEAKGTSEPDVRLLAEPTIVSDFAHAPTGFRTGYVALLERLDGYRPSPQTTTEASRRRDQLLKRFVVKGGEVRFLFEPPASVGGVATVRYRMVSRSDSERREAMVTDLWKGSGGRYSLASTKIEPLPATDFAEARSRLVQQAKQELANIEERVRQREAAVKEAIEARRREEAEQRRLEQERQDREERERRAMEDRQRQREEYVRHYDGLRGDLDRVIRERDDASRQQFDAQRDYESRSSEARRLRSERDEAKQKVRDLEDKLERAKSEGKPTGIIEQVLREAKQQADDKDDRYRDADHRADQARDRMESLARTVRDLESRRGEIEGEMLRVKSLIDSLG
ncbi:MAG TPA: hypothetical protein VGE01_12725 [Fimbriimonas sp.]